MDSPLTPSSSDDGGGAVPIKSARELAADAYVQPKLSDLRRYSMLALFCAASYLDSLFASCLFPALNNIQARFNLKPTEVAWVFGAYSASFSAFLLISGRVSDVYSSRACFIIGSLLIGAFSLGGGFASNKVGFFILRAFAGVGAAFNVPSALSLIVEWFPAPEEQKMAIAVFGSCAGIGNITGFLIGGVFVQLTTWRWILWFTGIFGLGTGALAFIILPPSGPRRNKPSWRKLDLGGVAAITGAIILFVYGITTGPIDGWDSGNCLAPLIISIALGAGFFVYETRIPADTAALPPKVWRYPNVPILFAVGFVPFFWWASVFLLVFPRMISEYHWSAIISAVHFLPVGISATATAIAAPTLVRLWSPKYSIAAGLALEFIAAMLLPFATSKRRYWGYEFPAFIIGSVGTMCVYANANIAIFMNIPPSMAGVTGAIFNSALQLSVAIATAVEATIQQSVNQSKISKGENPGYDGTAASFWFLVAYVAIQFLGVLIFYKPESGTKTVDEEGNVISKNEKDASSGRNDPGSKPIRRGKGEAFPRQKT